MEVNRTSIYAVLSGVALFPALIWYQSIGDFLPYLNGPYPPGQLPYILSKLFGMYALAAINFQVLFVLLSALGIKQLYKYHGILGMLIAFAALLHYSLFVVAVTLRQDSFAAGLLLLSFKDYFHTYVSIGLISFYALLFVIGVGILRRRNGRSFGRWLHKVYLFFIVGVYLHCLAIGSEVQETQFGVYLYCFAVVIGGLFAVLIIKNRNPVNATS